MWRIGIVVLFVLAGVSGELRAADFDEVLRQLRSVCVAGHCEAKFERENAEWHIVSLAFATEQITDADFQRIAALKTLERLGLVGEIHATRDGWRRLRAIHGLIEISLPDWLNADVLKAGWDPQALSGIHTLSLPFAASDEVLQDLAGLSKLTSLTYYGAVEAPTRAQQTTDASVAKLRDFPDLQRLALPIWGVGDDSLGPIIGLKKLEELNLIGSSVTAAGTPRLAALSNLRSLSINWLDQQGADALKILRGLQGLHIAASEAKSIDLSGFSSIQSLTLATDDDPVAWGKPLQWPPNLQSLCMSAWAMNDARAGRSVLRHRLPATVRSVRLVLGGPRFCFPEEQKPSDLTWLQRLPNLADLELVDPTPKDVSSILALAHLRRLALTGGSAWLTEKQIEKVNGLQELESLAIMSGYRAAGAALGAIAEIKGLRELTITATRPGITKLWALSGLEKLTLELPEAVGGAAVDDPLLGIGALSELKELTLAGEVTDAEIKNLAGLRKLRLLDLSRCEGFSDVGLAELVKSLPELKTVFWAWRRPEQER